jgi:hypothetical protein
MNRPELLGVGLAGDAGMLTVDVPDPVAEEGPVEGNRTEGTDNEDREQRPCCCSHAFDGWPRNEHSVEVLVLWGHKAPLCRPNYATTPTTRHSRSQDQFVSTQDGASTQHCARNEPLMASHPIPLPEG